MGIISNILKWQVLCSLDLKVRPYFWKILFVNSTKS